MYAKCKRTWISSYASGTQAKSADDPEDCLRILRPNSYMESAGKTHRPMQISASAGSGGGGGGGGSLTSSGNIHSRKEERWIPSSWPVEGVRDKSIASTRSASGSGNLQLSFGAQSRQVVSRIMAQSPNSSEVQRKSSPAQIKKMSDPPAPIPTQSFPLLPAYV